MSETPPPPRRRHRAVVLVLLMLLALAFLVFTFPAGGVSGRSLVALGVVVLLAAAGGIAFSWARYFPKR